MARNLAERVRAANGAPAEAPLPDLPDPREPIELSPGAFVTVTEDPPPVVPVHVALARVMRDVRAVSKDEVHNAPGARFNFRGIDAVVNKVGPALRRHGVLVLPEVLTLERRDVRTSGDKPAREVTVTVRYTFVGPDGTTLSAIAPGEAMDNGDKAVAKAMSVAFRVALLQSLALPTDEPDPDSFAYERAYEPPAPVDPADTARVELFQWCSEQRPPVDLVAVRKSFARQFGQRIAAVTDAGSLRAFTAALRADPEHVLAMGADPAPESAGEPSDEPAAGE